ncbi:MAG: hypothetical protein US94_C0001G0013 [Berkelbacteria bacterium GW2011_GWB1_38_5]|uniref:Large ribosomal subunit protein uL29 n=2 Tax=Candidatus Berkelbacteria TaxID=1618330 RepID=A0A0G0NYM7_9BACT|nr:MAG: hypothetical protein US94_C0001G0013 [Berkelbacteria bacterium GW2011_GWB1_38_5]KKQ90969.1 MAG: hypothetical protein UT15_C0002G0042 [Berkelbacteria bacterium GW2011_GWA1_39_10]
MKKQILLKELRTKDSKLLIKELHDSQKLLTELKFKSSFNKLKNYREINFQQKKIARVWSILTEKAMSEIKEKNV